MRSFRRKSRPTPLQLSPRSPVSYERRDGDDSTSSDLSPQTERPFSPLSSLRSSSATTSKPYSTPQFQLSASKSTSSLTTQTTSKRSFTRTTFTIFTETQTESIRSPKEKEEQSPTQTVFITVPPQLITVTLASKASTTSSSSSIGAEPVRVVGGNSFSPVAVKFLIALSVIGGVALVVGMAVIFRQRRMRNTIATDKGKKRLSG